jgi:hypothetical protein
MKSLLADNPLSGKKEGFHRRREKDSFHSGKVEE